jgi:EAL domain-containing protein (putative c-di-GMP-specific phosphodiesterase class I)/CheY-like chemotaxis protein
MMSSLPEEVRVLVVDDHPQVRSAFRRVLDRAGYAVTTEEDAPAAVDVIRKGDFDVVLTDLCLPSGTGMDVLRAARLDDPSLPVVFITGTHDIDIAHQALDQGALRFLTKPVSADQLLAAVGEALRARNVNRAPSSAKSSSRMRALDGDLSRVKQAAAFDQALDQLWMALQPVSSMTQRRTIAYEALVRSDHPTLGRPDLLVAAAESLGRVYDLGRRIRATVAERFADAPTDVDILVNLHPSDLADPDLFDPEAPLTAWAPRVILEITERASLSELDDVQERVARLRKLGYRIAVDDLGAGYGSLSAMALIRPDLVKIDMSLVRNVDADPVRLRMIKSIGSMCQQLGTPWLCEGVETRGELEILVANGVDLVQGYFLGRPARALQPPSDELLASVPRHRGSRRPSQKITLAPMAQAVCREAMAMAAAPSVPTELKSLLAALHDILGQLAD